MRSPSPLSQPIHTCTTPCATQVLYPNRGSRALQKKHVEVCGIISVPPGLRFVHEPHAAEPVPPCKWKLITSPQFAACNSGKHLPYCREKKKTQKPQNPNPQFSHKQDTAFPHQSEATSSSNSQKHRLLMALQQPFPPAPGASQHAALLPNQKPPSRTPRGKPNHSPVHI